MHFAIKEPILKISPKNLSSFTSTTQTNLIMMKTEKQKFVLKSMGNADLAFLANPKIGKISALFGLQSSLAA